MVIEHVVGFSAVYNEPTSYPDISVQLLTHLGIKRSIHDQIFSQIFDVEYLISNI